MTVPCDVELPQVSVLGSTMAYRQAGNPDAPAALFLQGTRPRRTYGGMSFPRLHRQRIASHRISSGSANRENQTSSIGLPTMFGTSMRSSLTLESRRHSS